MSHPEESILVRGVNWLGDAVMTTPALQRLRETRPKARIVLLTPGKLAGLWSGHPALDEVMPVATGEGVWTVARRLRREHFSTALILPNSPRSALESFLARIPERVGTARRWRNWCLTKPVPPRAGEVPMRKRPPAEVRALVESSAPRSPHYEPLSPTAHHIFQYLHLTAALGANPAAVAPFIAVGPEEVDAIRTRFGTATATPGGRSSKSSPIIIGLNPGAEYGPAKRWPAERFAAAAIALGEARAWNCHFWVLGGPGDRELAAQVVTMIAAGAPAEARSKLRSIAGETSLRELCAALKACAMVLTNDTGPMHVAAAVGTPVVVPFGSTSWRMTGPGLPDDPRHRFLEAGAPCSPCFLRACPIDFRCMTGITVENVVRESLSILSGR